MGARILADIQTRSAYRMRDEPSVYVCSETPSLVHSALNYILPRFLRSFSSASIHGTSTTVLLDERTLFSSSFPRIKFYCRMYFSSSHHRIARTHTFPSVHHIACVCVRARVFPVCIVNSCGRESCVCKFESVNALSIDIFSSIWNFASLHRMRYVYGIPEHDILCECKQFSKITRNILASGIKRIFICRSLGEARNGTKSATRILPRDGTFV